MSTTSSEPRRFSQVLSENLKAQDFRVFGMRKASLIIISGGVGEGKTTLAVQVMDEINQLHALPEVDLYHPVQLAMGGEDFQRKLLECHAKGLPVVAYDEAGDFNKRGALSRFNAMLNRIFETYRGFKIIVILCLPEFSVLDQDLFYKNIPRLLLRCHSRTNSQGNAKGYSLKRMLWIRERMKKLVVKSDAYSLVEPNFHMHFKDLSPERSKQLDLISTRGKVRGMSRAAIQYEGLVTYSDLAQKVARGEDWVARACRKLKIKPKRRFERRLYFPPEAIDALVSFVEGGGRV